MEFRKRCNVCGTIFCYTDEDLKKNTQNAGMAALNALGGLASTLGGGTIFHTHHLQGQADRHLDKVIDYDQCPNCHSRDLSFLDEGTILTQQIPSQVASVNINTSASTEALLKRVFLFLEDGNWASADAYCESCLDRDPELAEAYLGKLMAELQVKKPEELATLADPLDGNGNYQKALRFGNEGFRQTLSGYNEKIYARKELERQQKEYDRLNAIYTRANDLMLRARTEKVFLDAARTFESISDFQDAALLAQDCYEMSKMAKKDEILEQAKSKMKGSFISEYEYAIRILRTIRGWKNADQLIAECEDTIRRIHEEKERKERELEEQIKRSKKKRTMIFLLGGVALLLIVFVVILFTSILPGNQPNDAPTEVGNTGVSQNVIADPTETTPPAETAPTQQPTEQPSEPIHEETPKLTWEETGARRTIAAGHDHTVAAKKNGTAVATAIKFNKEYDFDSVQDYGQSKVGDWKDLVAVAAGDQHTVGLRSDGTVVATGTNWYKECEVGTWRDIVAVAAGYEITMGLKSDGTVLATGYNAFGQCNVGKWQDIVAVAAGFEHTVGLKSDGTVVTAGWNQYGQCDVSDWTDIVAIAADDQITVGLKSDGTVVAVGNLDQGKDRISHWGNIVAIDAESSHIVGLKSDGTVVAAGYSEDSRCHVGKWKNIVAVAAGSFHTVGLKSDGTVVSTKPVKECDFGQSNVGSWKNIKKP